MERHFALPITFAAALHAGLLFGFRPSLAIASKEPARIPAVRLSDPIVMVLPDPPKSDATPEETASPKGASTQERPTLPEPVPAEHPNGFPVTLPPTNPSVTVSGPKLDLSPFGRPDGLDNAINPPAGLFGANQLDNPPRARLQASPSYPTEAKTRGLTGTVTVEFTVDEHGMVVDPHVVNSTDRVFEDATLRAVAKWRFEPGRRANRVVRFRMAVPVVFNLNEN